MNETTLLSREIKGILTRAGLKKVPVKKYSDYRIEVYVYGNSDLKQKVQNVINNYYNSSISYKGELEYIGKVNISII